MKITKEYDETTWKGKEHIVIFDTGIEARTISEETPEYKEKCCKPFTLPIMRNSLKEIDELKSKLKSKGIIE